MLTKDGYDLQWGTNVLGHFYFAKLLLPALTETSKISPDGKTRLVITSSASSMLIDKIDFDTLHGKDNEKRIKLGTVNLYSQSKFVRPVVDSTCAVSLTSQCRGMLL